jgi:2'-5' RNA ligase
MRRYFVAIQLPNDSKDRLLSIQPSALPGIRLIGRDEFHLTLHYLGDVSDRCRELARRALEKVKSAEFSITNRGLGLFLAEGQPTVLWCGVEKHPALDSIHRSVGAVLSGAIGFEPEKRPYTPHVTLARFNGPSSTSAVECYLEENKGFHISAIFVKQFELYSSSFVDDVPQYREEAAFSLLKD